MAEEVRLCPHCANSIGLNAAKCPYCKADLESGAKPQWPTKEGEPSLAGRAPNRARVSTLSIVFLVAGLAALSAGLYLVAMPRGGNETQLLLEEKIKELQEKEQKIETLEAEAAKSRQTLTEQAGQLSELKIKLEESQKELASVRVRLGVANREMDRLASSRPQPTAPTASRSPAPVPPTASARRSVEVGLYETIRATSVYEDPSGASRVLSQIPPGTRVNVVRSVGGWLEVRSKQGNPPGFIRLDDARFIARAD